MANTFTKLLFHIVFSTKGRKPLIKLELQKDLYRYVGGIIKREGGVMFEIGGMPDHVHIVAKFKADASVSKMLRVIKSNSSKWVNELPGKNVNFEWQRGYAAFSVSESQLDGVRRYVRNQESHHQKLSFQDEFRLILKRHKIECDEQYMWD